MKLGGTMPHARVSLLLGALLVGCGASTRAAAPTDTRVQVPDRDLEGVQVHLTIDDLPWQIERTTPMPLPPEQAQE